MPETLRFLYNMQEKIYDTTEVLGRAALNVVPHLHCHIIPRYLNDGYWGGPLWWRPLEKRSELSTDRYTTLALRLQTVLRMPD